MKLSNVVSIILPLVPLVLAAAPKVNKVEFMPRHVPYESMDIEVTSVVLTFDQDVFTPDYEAMVRHLALDVVSSAYRCL